MTVALVTGASGGLGVAIAGALRDSGWDVVTTDVPGSGADLEADLRDVGGCAAIIDAAIGGHSRLDLLVNNAATMYHGNLTVEDLPRWWDTIDVNLSAPFRLARAACGELRRTRGQIINVASAFGVMAAGGYSAYCSAKSGLIGLTKALALELAPDVRVNAIAPGHIDTPQQAVDAKAAGLTRDELYRQYATTLPIGRILEPVEVARLVVYLAGESGYTGSCIHLNGGLVLA